MNTYKKLKILEENFIFDMKYAINGMNMMEAIRENLSYVSQYSRFPSNIFGRGVVLPIPIKKKKIAIRYNVRNFFLSNPSNKNNNMGDIIIAKDKPYVRIMCLLNSTRDTNGVLEKCCISFSGISVW
jgi:hypothetical protein